jgi:hypothetical protein
VLPAALLANLDLTDTTAPMPRPFPPGPSGGNEQLMRQLPALLRRHRDLEPLDPARWPWHGETAMAWPRTWGHRYLLICRWGSATPLRIAAWKRQGEGPGQQGGWARLCAPIPLCCFSERFLTPRGGQEMTRATPSPTTMRAMAPTAQ